MTRLSLGAAIPQLQAYIDFLHQYNVLSTRSLRRFEDRRAQRALAKTLLEAGKARLGSWEFSDALFRSIQGIPVHAVLGLDRSLRPRKALRAFAGHRFTPAVTNNLRHNLQLTCRPYRISLWYSDTDSPNGSVFETIVRRIQQSDFCLFDDRETEVRPNVLIELGVAIGLAKPYFYLNYQNKRTVTIYRRKERIVTASDLAGMLYISYAKYEDLACDLAMRLTGFLLDRKLVMRA